MAKANIETAKGTKIIIEGTADEIHKIIQAVNSDLHTQTRENEKVVPKSPQVETTKYKSKILGAKGRIETLIAKDFFKQPKAIGEVKEALETEGHIYPLTHLSPPLLRLTRKSQLRRLKSDKGGWTYVNP